MSGPEERLLRLVQEARRELESERRLRTEPIAIVGIGCRFPGGASSPEAFWRLLADGVDATVDVPVDRWDAEAIYDADPGVPGKSYVKRGGFLDRIDGFEPEFFGIAPRETPGLDPQQRLLLEVVWEALENAGIVPGSLKDSQTGVWIGFSLDDYARAILPPGQLERIDPYSALGNSRSVAAGRIAYVLGLHGPVMQVDTSCSSSIVAIHLACQSLRSAECNLALVGGVNLMSSPDATVALCKLSALSRDGRCKTFDAEADGYGRGEGAGIVVLKRLADAEAAGDRIYAVIRGSAVNHDGRSNGLTAPNGAAQEAVIRAALSNANVDPASVGYIEAHGTGTPLGDPIEVLALSRVYGAARSREMPLYLGSVKTNFGHLEGAAGIAGIIKTALCLSHARIAPHLHFRQPNPRIPWQNLAVRVAGVAEDWPTYGERHRAGVSSFGISGTNAHVIVEQAPLASPAQAEARSAELVVLSARTTVSLTNAAARLRDHVEGHPELALQDIAYSSIATRAAMERRLALVARSTAELREALESVAGGNIRVDEELGGPSPCPKVAFVFPGQGSQWLGMGRQLLVEEPAFSNAMAVVDRAIAAETGWSVIEELTASAEASRLDRVDVVQPVLFAVQMALASLWRSWGVEPDAVVGHSMGEVAAACVAGALALEEGVAIVCRRSALLRRISGRGEMALVELSATDAAAVLAGYETRLGVAVSNSRRSTVLSGDPDALADLLAKLEARGVFGRRIKVDVASHSPQVDPLLEELVSALRDLRPQRARVPMVSTVTAGILTGLELGARYWSDNLRRPVSFLQATEALLTDGITLFIEVSPHPILVQAIEEIRGDAARKGAAVGSLRREQAERFTLLESLGTLHQHGLALSAQRLFPKGARRVELPTYSWERKRYWIEASFSPRGESGQATIHPLLGVRVSQPGADAVYESALAANQTPWLVGARGNSSTLVSAAALTELARAAAEDQSGQIVSVVELGIERPLAIAHGGLHRVRTVVRVGGLRVEIYDCPTQGDDSWTLNATARIGASSSKAPAPLAITEIRQRCEEVLDVQATYQRFSASGLHYDPRALKSLRRGQGEMIAEVALIDGTGATDYGLHPALLDAAFQATAGAFGSDGASWPVELKGTNLYQAGATSCLVYARRNEDSRADRIGVSMILADTTGAPIATIDEVEFRPVDRAATGASQTQRPYPELHRLEWRASPPPPEEKALSGRWLVVGVGQRGAAAGLVRELTGRGATSELVSLDRISELPPAEHVVCLWDAEQEIGQALRVAEEALAVAQALAGMPIRSRFWWLTRNAVAASPGDEIRPMASPAWGVGRTVMQEHPRLGLILLDLDVRHNAAAALARELSAADDETEIAWRDDLRYVARVVRVPPGAPNKVAQFRNDGTVLVTGGLGALGLQIAQSLAQQGMPHLILAGRRTLENVESREAIAEIERLGTRVTLAAIDVADGNALSRLFASIPPNLPLRGIVHAAGVLDDGIIVDQTPARFANVMSPKVLGGWNLHLLTERAELDRFVVFSSLAGTVGSSGQSGYAAANAFLDSLVAYRRARGLPGQSLAWGPWADAGLAARLDPALRARFTRRGIGALAPARGRELFEAAMARPESHLVPAALDPRAIAAEFGTPVPPRWRALARPVAVSEKTAAWLNKLSSLDPSARREAMTDLVRTEVARVLGMPNLTAVPLETPLKDIGMDSLMALEMRNGLAKHMRTAPPATLPFAKASVQAIADHLLGLLASGAPRLLGSDGSVASCEDLKNVRNPKARLFCFHDAAGSSTMFAPLTELASLGIEVHAIGHRREATPSHARAAQYLRETIGYIRALADRPYALFGHSLGALFAFRVAQEIANEGIAAPEGLVASGSASPEWVSNGLAKEDLESVFRIVFGRTAQTAMNLWNAFSADTLLWRAMRPLAFNPLDVPILGIRGEADHVAGDDSMRRWARLTTRSFALRAVPGGHFYLTQGGIPRWLFDELTRLLLSADNPNTQVDSSS